MLQQPAFQHVHPQSPTALPPSSLVAVIFSSVLHACRCPCLATRCCLLPLLLLLLLQHALTSNKCVDQLDNLHKVNTRLVGAVSTLVGELRAKVAAAITAAAGSSSNGNGSAGGGGGATDAASITAAAMAGLGEGSWTYGDIMREYIYALKLTASFCSDYFSEGLAAQLWDALMVDAPTWDHLGAAAVRAGLCLRHLTAGASAWEANMDLLCAPDPALAFAAIVFVCRTLGIRFRHPWRRHWCCLCCACWAAADVSCSTSRLGVGVFCAASELLQVWHPGHQREHCLL